MRLNSFIRKRHQNTLRGDSDEAADEITALPEGGKGSDLSGVG